MYRNRAICPECGINEIVPGRSLCSVCLQYHKRRQELETVLIDRIADWGYTLDMAADILVEWLNHKDGRIAIDRLLVLCRNNKEKKL